jgi:hypothetical protein
MTAAAGAPPITEANVLGRSDEILSWDRAKEQEKDARFVQLGECLCEVRAKQYWRLEKLNSFEEFLRSTSGCTRVSYR